MKICIVNYEQGMGISWIFTKYARALQKELIDEGHEAFISEKPEKADVNYHFNYLAYKPSGGLDCVMITHLTGDKNKSEAEKIKFAKECLKTSHGICMNKGLVEKLVKAGVSRDKLDFVYHAHDSLPRRPRIITMCYTLHEDGRQRGEMFTKLFRSFKNKNDFIFRVMGKNWLPILDPLTNEGIQVQMTDKFYGELYKDFLNTSDYLLFTGDEDSLPQSIVDATNAGLSVIAPPQDGIEVEYPFNNQEELNAIFAKLAENPVKDWTWNNYAKSHIAIWRKLRKQK